MRGGGPRDERHATRALRLHPIPLRDRMPRASELRAVLVRALRRACRAMLLVACPLHVYRRRGRGRPRGPEESRAREAPGGRGGTAAAGGRQRGVSYGPSPSVARDALHGAQLAEQLRSTRWEGRGGCAGDDDGGNWARRNQSGSLSLSSSLIASQSTPKCLPLPECFLNCFLYCFLNCLAERFPASTGSSADGRCPQVHGIP